MKVKFKLGDRVQIINNDGKGEVGTVQDIHYSPSMNEIYYLVMPVELWKAGHNLVEKPLTITIKRKELKHV